MLLVSAHPLKNLKKKMTEKFEERFSRLKDNVVTLMAEKLSVLIEENNTLKSTLENEVKDLLEVTLTRNWRTLQLIQM